MHLGWQAKQRPDAIAVIESGGRTVTYAELDARSRQPAAALGLRPGDTLAIRMPSGAHLLPSEIDEMAEGKQLTMDRFDAADRAGVAGVAVIGVPAPRGANGSSRWSSRPPPT
ncbi:AMP-binding protein [Streptomyces mirabilis]